MLPRLICLVLGHRRCMVKVAGGYFLDSHDWVEIWHMECDRCGKVLAAASQQELREMIAHKLLRAEEAGR